MKENIMQIVTHIIGNTWLFIIIGLIHIVFIEYELIFKYITRKSKAFKELIPVFKRLYYIFLGVLLIIFSYSIVRYLADFLVPSSFLEIDYSNIKVNDFWSLVKYQEQYAGLIALIGFCMAGISLILSGGGKWLVNLAKLFITLSVLYLVFVTFVAYS